MPTAVSPWNVTAQDPVKDKVQVVELKDPPVVPAAKVNVTTPEGMFEGVVVSVTVAEQVEVCPGIIDPGVHDTLVEVVSFAAPTIVTE